jgi:FixJ family two-component response regulator
VIVQKSTDRSKAAAPINTGPSVLVVDDCRHTVKALSVLLRGSGYHPVVFNTGRDALAFDMIEDLAAAIIDIHLPDINGLVLSQKLREMMGPEKAIIVLSGDTSMETLNSLPHVGATYFFSKPVNAAQLLEHMRRWVGPVAVDAKMPTA